jgi:hypothetical protein
MSDLRRTISWLLLVLLAVVGAGGAVLGATTSRSSGSALSNAVESTLGASSYTQVVTEQTPQGNQTDHLVWQAPNRLGGYIQSGSRRTYVYVLPSAGGYVEYQSLTVPASTPTSRLVFYKQASQSAALLDPAHNYLGYAKQAKHVTQTGDTYSFTLTQNSTSGKETGTFVYTVSGQYVTEFLLTVQSASVHMVISSIGSSPPVRLPAGARVATTPANTPAAAPTTTTTAPPATTAP